jgi:hypothetical protein
MGKMVPPRHASQRRRCAEATLPVVDCLYVNCFMLMMMCDGGDTAVRTHCTSSCCRRQTRRPSRFELWSTERGARRLRAGMAPRAPQGSTRSPHLRRSRSSPRRPRRPCRRNGRTSRSMRGRRYCLAAGHLMCDGGDTAVRTHCTSSCRRRQTRRPSRFELWSTERGAWHLRAGMAPRAPQGSTRSPHLRRSRSSPRRPRRPCRRNGSIIGR